MTTYLARAITLAAALALVAWVAVSVVLRGEQG